MKKTLILKANQVARLGDIKKTIQAVERSFVDYAQNKAQMPPKVYLDIKKHNGDFRAMPAYLENQTSASLKWVNVHPNNRSKNIPTVMAVIILSDPKTGFPLSIMDGTLITKWRTAASSAIATKYLARKDVKILSIIGCGAQAQTQIEFACRVRKFKQINLWDIDLKTAQKLKPKLSKKNIKVFVYDGVKECVQDADVITTITPSRRPLIKKEWLKSGVHINAIGADAKGKQELANDIIKSATIVIDDWEQASHSGEINVPLSKKIIYPKNIKANLGQIITGKKKIQHKKSGITVFDSTGLAIQDTAVAQMIYKSAIKSGLGQLIQLV